MPPPLTPEEFAKAAAISDLLAAAVVPFACQKSPWTDKEREYIYLTRAEFGYKIGRTTHPDSRPLRVAGNCPIKLEVVAVIEVDDMRKAEVQLHSYFAAKRLRGEWFALNEEDVTLVKGYPKSFENLTFPDEVDVPF